MIEWFNKLDTHALDELDTHDAYTFMSLNMEKYHFKICNIMMHIPLPLRV